MTLAEMLARHYPTPLARLVLTRGRVYTSSALTPEEYSYLCLTVENAQMRFPIKQCYRNAQRLLLRGDVDERLSYVEGYAWRKSIGVPIEHGWLEINGKAIDFTMRHPPRQARRFRDRVVGAWSDDREYVGVPLPRKRVYESLARGFWGPLARDVDLP